MVILRMQSIMSKLKLPWDKAREILGESKGANLIAVGILLMVLTTSIRLYCDTLNISDNFSTLFYMASFLLIFWGALSYLSEK